MSEKVEEAIIALIKQRGPLTGAEIRNAIPLEGLELWQACFKCPHLKVRTVGTRYLRLDRRLPEFARLSPSIWRSFLTYSVIGFTDPHNGLEQRTADLSRHIEAVSRSKLDVAFQTVSALAAEVENVEKQACFIIAGDIVYNMSHDVPRPERSTGKMVNGSDMDLVVLVSDQCPESYTNRLDEAIYRAKFRLLLTPHLREEVDYVIKPFSRVREQVRFDSFVHMLACKILQEGTFLYGNELLFEDVKTLLRTEGAVEKLKKMETAARAHRRNAEKLLKNVPPGNISQETLDLFYPSEESEEFE